ncbi:MAG: TRAP transporter small permease subunit [Rhodospirillales bacterium]|nr:TRAP transporter small permease subunit [Rhodospirillales bacterium]MCW8862460.1 TRAP transporter small permease subunit [Rhodospirillales bacterium]MCW8952515.1 TRAP transporter small permease subunit [Rhodospirillales bacterium]MCW8970033.1 TRAP transporter small permease subunit [Rhodospirillales bacterium]MCW9038988.1 TRAP transporter small permease subunit [Rhodospirillales bacterium]
MNIFASLANAIDTINDRIGKITAWAALAMVIIQFVVVVMRYVFGIGSIMMQETIIYLHSILFLLGGGYTLLVNGHVRVDIFYRTAKVRSKAWVDFLGVTFLMLPVCILLWWASWPYVSSSWRVFEGSVETSGIPAVFLLKTAILAFVFLMGLQAVSVALRALFVILGQPRRD